MPLCFFLCILQMKTTASIPLGLVISILILGAGSGLYIKLKFTHNLFALHYLSRLLENNNRKKLLSVAPLASFTLKTNNTACLYPKQF